MNGSDFTAILPLIVLGGTVTTVMLAIAFCRNHRLTVLLSVLGLILCLIAIWPASDLAARQGERGLMAGDLMDPLHHLVNV